MPNTAKKKGDSSCKPQWVFTLKDGSRSVLFRRRADGKHVPTYDVRRGDVFYDGLGGMGRRPHVKNSDACLMIQVNAALSGEKGEVKFTLYRIINNQYRKIGSTSCTQRRFLIVLRDGVPSGGK